MKKASIVRTAMGIVLGLAFGCGGDGDGAADGFTSVSGTKPVNTLTTTELTQFCKDGDAYVAQQISDELCKFSAVLSVGLLGANTEAEARARCMEFYEKCIAEPVSAGDPSPLCSSGAATCTATVNELAACSKKVVSSIKTVYAAAPSCQTLKLSDLSATPNGGTVDLNPAECKALEASCPAASM